VTAPEFEIEIVSQGWITEDEESMRNDLCSHGEVRLVIGGETIVAPERSDVTLSTSALALLRTLERDHSPQHTVAEYLLLHCGQIWMASCPRSVDWSVEHVGDQVRLFDVVDADGRRFPHLAVELDEDVYRRAIVAFAEEAKEPFVGIKKELDGSEREVYDAFWHEYDELLARYS
jgi:hypothetical protein